MKLKQEFIAHQAGTETVLIPTGKAGFSGIVKGNESFGFILELLTRDRTEDEIVSAMLEHFDAPKDRIAADVHRALDTLRDIGALES